MGPLWGLIVNEMANSQSINPDTSRHGFAAAAAAPAGMRPRHVVTPHSHITVADATVPKPERENPHGRKRHQQKTPDRVPKMGCTNRPGEL